MDRFHSSPAFMRLLVSKAIPYMAKNVLNPP
jgi:hypothetical protein